MEVPATVDNTITNKSEAHLTSAAAFVEGGIQEACDDACSICLEDFCEGEPSSVTGCKHEFHLQCILEWCQRSSQCPMCWQAISLKDPDSQELLEAVEHERNLRFNPPRNATIFHHPTLGDFELQHLPVRANDAELEERIIQHLAAAAAMGRARHIARRDGQRSRSSAQGRPQFLVFSTQPNSPVLGPTSSLPQRGESEQLPALTAATTFSPPATMGEESFQGIGSVPSAQADQVSASASGSSGLSSSQHGSPLNNRRSPSQSSPTSQDRAGSSEQSFSESFKSRFNAVSSRYKESISKSTRGWKERLFSRNTSMADIGSEVRREVNAAIASVSRNTSMADIGSEVRREVNAGIASVSRNTSMADIGSEVRREVNAGIASVSRMMEHLETRDNDRASDASVSNRLEDNVTASESRQLPETGGSNLLSESNVQAPHASGPGPGTN